MYSKKERVRYLKALPRKRSGVNVILQDTRGRILIVKPSYRRRWLLPGGVVEENESPLECGIREVNEELGLVLSSLRFVGVDYVRARNGTDENFQFIFYGGQIASEHIRIDEKEIVDFRFVSRTSAEKLLGTRSNSTKRLQKCIFALKTQQAVYIEKRRICR